MARQVDLGITINSNIHEFSRLVEELDTSTTILCKKLAKIESEIDNLEDIIEELDNFVLNFEVVND